MKTSEVKEQLQEYIASMKAEDNDRWKISNPEDAYAVIAPIIANEKQEVFMIITLNSNNEVINTHEITRGLLNSSQVHAREVFVNAIKDLAASIVTAHNHPSGNINMSTQDLQSYYKLKEASDIIGIPIRDNLIVGSQGYTSFLVEGKL